ncbi:MAG: EamA family transporter [Patescibacteria group bacterium]
MSWLLIVVVAYALNAVAIAIDKALLKQIVPHPGAYTFFIALLGALGVVLWPFEFALPTASQAALAVVIAITFVAALYLMFRALKRGDASRIAPFIGGLSPLFVFMLAAVALGERLAGSQLVAVAVMLAGTLLISWHRHTKKALRGVFRTAAAAAACFAVSYVLTKVLYEQAAFIPAFVWIRIAVAVVAVGLLWSPATRQAVKQMFTQSSGESQTAFGIGQAAGALSMILISWAISLASVSMINALQGLQYIFLFGIVLALKGRYPKLLDEDLSPAVYVQKIISILLIGGGLLLVSWPL